MVEFFSIFIILHLPIFLEGEVYCLFLLVDFREREKKVGVGGERDLLFHLFTHSLVDS